MSAVRWLVVRANLLILVYIAVAVTAILVVK